MDAEKVLMNKKYKDSVFRKLFGENQENALSLANAISGQNYPPGTEVEFNTIGTMIFMNIRNDVSYVIHDRMFMMEHQSTICPNMPVRELLYFARELNKYVGGNESLYGSKRIMFPAPCCYVFCNASDMKEDSYTEKLSDSFMNQDVDTGCEWSVRVININYGHNKQLMDACEALRGYSIFVEQARKWQSVMPGVEGMDRAIDECIAEGVLVQFLTEHRMEVRNMAMDEFNVEKYLTQERDASYNEGKADVLKELVRDNLISAEEAAKRLNVSLVKFMSLV